MPLLFCIICSALYRIVLFSSICTLLGVLMEDKDITTALDLQKWLTHDPVRASNVMCMWRPAKRLNDTSK